MTALAIAVPFGTAALTAWISIKIKFAPDAVHATREVMTIFLKVYLGMSYLYSAGALVWLFTSSRPIDRLFIFAVMLNSFALLNGYLLYWLNQVWNLFGKLSKTDEAIIKLVTEK